MGLDGRLAVDRCSLSVGFTIVRSSRLGPLPLFLGSKALTGDRARCLWQK
jgi:hypothetical protein